MEWNSGKSGDTDGRKIKNIYARGADDGFRLGLYLSVMFFLAVASLSVPLLNMAVVVMALGVPVLTYVFLRRTHVAAHGMTVFSALWMQGITTFACGSLLFGAVSLIYMRWINPGFMLDVLNAGVDYYSAAGTEGAKAIADELQRIINSKAIPTPLNVTFGWMWLGMFSGSLLSMLVAAVVKFKKVPAGR